MIFLADLIYPPHLLSNLLEHKLGVTRRHIEWINCEPLECNVGNIINIVVVMLFKKINIVGELTLGIDCCDSGKKDVDFQGGTQIRKKDPGSIFFLRPPSAGLTNYIIRHISQYSKKIKLRLKCCQTLISVIVLGRRARACKVCLFFSEHSFLTTLTAGTVMRGDYPPRHVDSILT